MPYLPRPKLVILVALALGVLVVLAPRASAGIIFTGSASGLNSFTASYVSGGTASGTLTETGGELESPADGLRYTGANPPTPAAIVYTAVQADVGQTIDISAIFDRPFTYTAGDYAVENRLAGSVSVTGSVNGRADIVAIDGKTQWDGNTNRSASVDITSFGPNGSFLGDSTTDFHAATGITNPINLRLFLTIAITPTAVGETFTIDFPNSAEAFTFALPEPGTMTLAGVGIIGLLAYRWKRGRC